MAPAPLELAGAVFISHLFDCLSLQSAFALSTANKQFWAIFNSKSQLPVLTRHPLFLLSPVPLSLLLRCIHSQLQARTGLSPSCFPVTSQEYSWLFHSLQTKGRCLHFSYIEDRVLVWGAELRYERVEKVAVLQGIPKAVSLTGAGKRYAIASSEGLIVSGKFSLKALNTEGVYSHKAATSALPALFLPSQLLFLDSGRTLLVGGVSPASSQVLVFTSRLGTLQATIQLESHSPPLLATPAEDSCYWALAADQSPIRVYCTETQLVWERQGRQLQYRQLFPVAIEGVKVAVWYQRAYGKDVVEYEGCELAESVLAASVFQTYLLILTEPRDFHLYDLDTRPATLQTFHPSLSVFPSPPSLFLQSTHFHLAHSSLLSIEYTGQTPFTTLALPMREVTCVHFLPAYTLIQGRVAGGRRTLAIAPTCSFTQRKTNYEELINRLEIAMVQRALMSEEKRIRRIDEEARMRRASKKAEKLLQTSKRPKKRVKLRKHRKIEIDYYDWEWKVGLDSII